MWFLIFQHASISLFPEEPYSELNHNTTRLVKKLLCWARLYSSRTTCTFPPEGCCWLLDFPARSSTGIFEFLHSLENEEGGDNHPHSSAPASPHPLTTSTQFPALGGRNQDVLPCDRLNSSLDGFYDPQRVNLNN